MKKYYGLIMGLCTCFIGQAALHKSSVVTKAFFHQGKLSDKVMFYFDVEPLCNELPMRSAQKNETGMKELVLFFPLTSLAREAKQNLNSLKDKNNSSYKISLEEVEKPIRGLRISVAYDPESIIFDYSSCDVISATKGFVMSFHNKKVLEKIKHASNSVLRYAEAEKPQKKRIVVDFGHGGRDTGTIGCHSLREKDVTLQVGRKVVSLLKQRGFEVCVTRDRDVFIPLDRRTTFANQKNAELFVSIHANSSRKKNIQGVETYWSSRCSVHKQSFTQRLNDNRAVQEFYYPFDSRAELLARCVHNGVLTSVSPTYQLVDRAVKKSISQVLIGTDMPATLIEIGFLSHPQEADWLSQDTNQIKIAAGICNGIEAYYKSAFAA
ncbi:MAG TPA: N-acetylmuramoyl-L-alanine amidase [Candidatus Babeliales bacterium]|nr:N-acetylmuramoyl-L-alanine amidase [Candidatus Babeliales bacterium]